MKHKLFDVENIVEEDVDFGTCDLCSSLGTHYYDVLVFEDTNGKEYEVENRYWSCGDYTTNWYIGNYVTFADFIKHRDYDEPENNQYGQPLFEAIVHQMYDDYLEWEKKEWIQRNGDTE